MPDILIASNRQRMRKGDSETARQKELLTSPPLLNGFSLIGGGEFHPDAKMT